MAGLLLIGALALLVAHIATVVIYLRRTTGQAARGAGLLGRPHVTLIRPLCGLNPFEEETLATSFRIDYPDYDLIFCVERADDPVLALIGRLVAEHPQVPAQILIGFERVTGNPKLNNLWKGWHAAQGDWVCLADSNLLLPPDYLDRVIESWGPRTGAVSSPPVGINPEGWPGALEVAFLNSNQARLQLVSDSLGRGFAQGKTLFFNKPMLERAGGLQALGRWLAEDVATTHVIRALGGEVTLTQQPFAQPVGRRRLADVWTRQLRWSRVRRDGFPWLFMLEPLNGALLPVLLMAGASAGFGAGLLPLLVYLLLWYGAEIALIWRAGWPSGARDLASLPLRDLLLPALWATTFLRRGFDWRGKEMDAASDGAGAETRPAQSNSGTMRKTVTAG